jgi:hypothetical protein
VETRADTREQYDNAVVHSDKLHVIHVIVLSVRMQRQTVYREIELVQLEL